MLRLLARGACTGLALFGGTVLCLGGASTKLLVAFWALGACVVSAKDWWLARRATRRMP